MAMEQLTFVDLCSGIGGFRLGLETAGHKCIGYCEYDKFARASYEAMYDTKGEWKANDVTKLTASEVPYADLWCFGFPCFAAGTLIMTDKGYKKIEDMKEGDMVLTHKARYRPVVKPMKQLAGSIYELDIFGVDKLCATKEHPFLVKHGEETKWKNAEDLEKGDLIAVPINAHDELPRWEGITYERSGKEYHLNNLKLDSEDFWWIVGCYMADGWYRVTPRKNASDNYRIVIACNEEKLERLKSYNGGMFHISVAKEQKIYKAHIVNKELTMFLMQFGKGAGNKRLSNTILNLPIRYLRAFLKGYFETNGCKIGKYHCASTVSKELAYGVQACVNKVYKRPCAIYEYEGKSTHIIEGRIVNQQKVYTLRFKEESSKKDGSFFMGEYVWHRFNGKTEIPFDDYVYNMEVKDDNSYTANNLGVHNCQDISVAGKQRGLDGERSGIYFNIIDIIKSKEESDKPTYLLVENVKNLLSINAGFDFATVLSEMDEAGYDCKWQVLNSKNFGVPQNRERVYIIGYLRSRGRREILSISGESRGTLKQLVGGMQGERVYDPTGISVTLLGSSGGHGGKTGLYHVEESGDEEVDGKIFIDQCYTKPKLTDIARCVTARYTSGMSKRLAQNSGVLEVHAILTPDRLKKRQNGRRMKEDGEPMFTLTGQDRHGVYLCKKNIKDKSAIKVKNATKKGFEEATCGDSVNLAFPDSKTRRGRVGKECSQTLDTSCNIGTVLKCGRIRRLTPRECFRLQGFPDCLFEKAASVNSDAQLYKQAGNAVTATVAYAVAMALPESR